MIILFKSQSGATAKNRSGKASFVQSRTVVKGESACERLLLKTGFDSLVACGHLPGIKLSEEHIADERLFRACKKRIVR
jgi:hypothetical protein